MVQVQEQRIPYDDFSDPGTFNYGLLLFSEGPRLLRKALAGNASAQEVEEFLCKADGHVRKEHKTHRDFIGWVNSGLREAYPNRTDLKNLLGFLVTPQYFLLQAVRFGGAEAGGIDLFNPVEFRPILSEALRRVRTGKRHAPLQGEPRKEDFVDDDGNFDMGKWMAAKAAWRKKAAAPPEEAEEDENNSERARFLACREALERFVRRDWDLSAKLRRDDQGEKNVLSRDTANRSVRVYPPVGPVVGSMETVNGKPLREKISNYERQLDDNLKAAQKHKDSAGAQIANARVFVSEEIRKVAEELEKLNTALSGLGLAQRREVRRQIADKETRLDELNAQLENLERRFDEGGVEGLEFEPEVEACVRARDDERGAAARAQETAKNFQRLLDEARQRLEEEMKEAKAQPSPTSAVAAPGEKTRSELAAEIAGIDARREKVLAEMRLLSVKTSPGHTIDLAGVRAAAREVKDLDLQRAERLRQLDALPPEIDVAAERVRILTEIAALDDQIAESDAELSRLLAGDELDTELIDEKSEIAENLQRQRAERLRQLDALPPEAPMTTTTIEVISSHSADADHAAHKVVSREVSGEGEDAQCDWSEGANALQCLHSVDTASLAIVDREAYGELLLLAEQAYEADPKSATPVIVSLREAVAAQDWRTVYAAEPQLNALADR